MAQLGKLQKSKTAVKPKRKSIFKDFSSRELLLLCIPGLIGQILFYDIPTGGIHSHAIQGLRLQIGGVGKRMVWAEEFYMDL